MQERPPRPVDRPDHARVERDRVDLDRQRVGRIDREQAAPSSTDPHDQVPLGRGAGDRRLDAGVEPGDVATPGEDPDLHADSVRALERPAGQVAAILGSCSMC